MVIRNRVTNGLSKPDEQSPKPSRRDCQGRSHPHPVNKTATAMIKQNIPAAIVVFGITFMK